MMLCGDTAMVLVRSLILATRSEVRPSKAERELTSNTTAVTMSSSLLARNCSEWASVVDCLEVDIVVLGSVSGGSCSLPWNWPVSITFISSGVSVCTLACQSGFPARFHSRSVLEATLPRKCLWVLVPLVQLSFSSIPIHVLSCTS